MLWVYEYYQKPLEVGYTMYVRPYLVCVYEYVAKAIVKITYKLSPISMAQFYY